ncbi:hypothetical protein DPMN_190516 [Dreissena polymorpha]|uniref:Uncharacterized protein n=1 Tax=Dreissena polymorpha TaxID=45954 RepID=A0A9D4ID71_DREPO|nr:hypothetical protein DPMN_190516 [Dreissena polymorpha]
MNSIVHDSRASGFILLLKDHSYYDAVGAPARDPRSTGMNRGSIGMNRGSTRYDRDKPGTTGTTGAPP